jgi:uncharacterized protein (TIGR03437 family)
VAFAKAAWGQAAPAAILQIDVENQVQYIEDISDVSKLATDPNITTANLKNFEPIINLGDIVAVNGQPAKGTSLFYARRVALSIAPAPGQAIADVVTGAIQEVTFEILNLDGVPIGTIMALGFGGTGTASPPGSPLAATQGNNTIVGGTGAFLGARGQFGQAIISQTVPARQASMSEDPANRRKNGGGRVRYVVHVLPQSQPQIVATAAGPAVFHTDFSAVTATKPAKAGEVLIVRATGLGPTRPGVDPGQPFPLDGLQEVNSPVGVTVNGQAAEVINKIGWPGLLETYRLDFRAPDGIAAGAAAVQLTAAWIAGPSVNIPVQ